MPEETLPSSGPVTSLEDPRLEIDPTSTILVVGGAECTNTVLRQAGLPVSRCADPSLLGEAFNRPGGRPNIVIAPLLAPTFDALDVIAVLARLGFQGQLLAVSAALPDVGAVLRELRADCAGFRLDILQVGG